MSTVPCGLILYAPTGLFFPYNLAVIRDHTASFQ